MPNRDARGRFARLGTAAQEAMEAFESLAQSRLAREQMINDLYTMAQPPTIREGDVVPVEETIMPITDWTILGTMTDDAPYTYTIRQPMTVRWDTTINYATNNIRMSTQSATRPEVTDASQWYGPCGAFQCACGDVRRIRPLYRDRRRGQIVPGTDGRWGYILTVAGAPNGVRNWVANSEREARIWQKTFFPQEKVTGARRVVRNNASYVPEQVNVMVSGVSVPDFGEKAGW